MTKPVIVKRNTKGSALTFTELDANFQNLDDATITLTAGAGGTAVVSDLNGTITFVATDGITFTGNNTTKQIAVNASLAQDTTPQLSGNLDVVTYKIVTSVTNGDISIEPPGTGNVNLNNDTEVTGYLRVSSSNAGTLGGTGPGAFSIKDPTFGNNIEFSAIDGTMLSSSGLAIEARSGNLSFGAANSANISIGGSLNDHIVIQPSGTGNVELRADTVQVGDSNAAATVTTNGTGNLILNTNAGTNSGSITINQGVNGAIAIATNGSGIITIAGPTFGIITSTAGASSITARHTATASNSLANYSFNAQKHRTDILLAAMTDEPAVIAFSVRDSGNNNRIFGRLIGRYAGTGTNPSFTFQHSVDGFTTTTAAATIGAGTAIWGAANSGYILTTNGTGNLTLSTNSGTDSGTIIIRQGLNADIDIEPSGTGNVDLITDTVVIGDAGAAATMTTNGAGNLILNTNNGTNAGSITLTQGTNGNITISPNGSGVTLTTGLMIGSLTSTAGVAPITGRHSATASASNSNFSLTAQKFRSDILLAAMTDEPAVVAFQVRDSSAALRTFGRLISRYKGTGSTPTLEYVTSVDNFATSTSSLVLDSGGGLTILGRHTYDRVHGSFYHDATITPAAANTVYVLPLNTTVAAETSDISIASTSRITIAKAGIFNIQFSLQLRNDDNSQENDLAIWLRKNSNDVAATNTFASVVKEHSGIPGRTVMALNFLVTAAANDYFELAYAVNSTELTIEAIAATTSPYVSPATPSVIVTVTPVGA
jgi:hypothetical protein